MGHAALEGKPMHVLPLEKRAEVIEHLMEGVRLRPASRLCGVSRNTIASLLLAIARGATWLHNRLVRDLDVVHVECDELHSFVKKRVKNITPADPPEIGEQWDPPRVSGDTPTSPPTSPSSQAATRSIPAGLDLHASGSRAHCAHPGCVHGRAIIGIVIAGVMNADPLQMWATAIRQ
jgi:hypothetical protein